ncbi:MAG: TnsA endonuclease N-terminal domain-containing protein [Blastocatellia bacterium]
MPVRKIPKSYCSVTGLVAGVDSNQMTAYESSLERDCIKHLIFNRNVAVHEEQPVTICFTDKDSKLREYTPDLLATYSKDLNLTKDWKPLLIEVKYREDLFKKWSELKPKFRAARHYAEEKGWDFTIITEKEIRTTYLRNIDFLIEFRKYPVDENSTTLLLNALEELGETDPATLIASISKEPMERARLIPYLWQLVADFIVGIDLEQPLTMRSPIWSTRFEEREDCDEFFYDCGKGHSSRIRWRALRYNPCIEP